MRPWSIRNTVCSVNVSIPSPHLRMISLVFATLSAATLSSVSSLIDQLTINFAVERQVASVSPLYLLKHSNALLAALIVVVIFTINSFMLANISPFLSSEVWLRLPLARFFKFCFFRSCIEFLLNGRNKLSQLGHNARK